MTVTSAGSTLSLFDPIGFVPIGSASPIFHPLVLLSPAGLTLRSTTSYGGYEPQIQLNTATGITLASGRNITMNGGSISGANLSSVSALSATGAISTSFGNISTTNGSLSAGNRLTIGTSLTGTGNYSGAVGQTVATNGLSSFAAGSNLTTTGNSTFVVGDNNTAASAYSAVFGRYALTPAGQSSTTWVATDDLFVIGNGIPGQPSNALTIKKSGDTTVSGGLTVQGGTTQAPVTSTFTRDVHVQGVLRVREAGDISMGQFTAGTQP